MNLGFLLFCILVYFFVILFCYFIYVLNFFIFVNFLVFIYFIYLLVCFVMFMIVKILLCYDFVCILCCLWYFEGWEDVKSNMLLEGCGCVLESEYFWIINFLFEECMFYLKDVCKFLKMRFCFICKIIWVGLIEMFFCINFFFWFIE